MIDSLENNQKQQTPFQRNRAYLTFQGGNIEIIIFEITKTNLTNEIHTNPFMSHFSQH